MQRKPIGELKGRFSSEVFAVTAATRNLANSIFQKDAAVSFLMDATTTAPVFI
jgi:hypothetical protein